MLYSVYLMLFGRVPYVICVCTSCYLCVYLKLYSVYHMLFSDLVGTIWYKVYFMLYSVYLCYFQSEVKDSLPRSDVRRSHRSILYVRDSSDPKYVTMTTIEGFCLPELYEMRNKTWMFRDVTYHLGSILLFSNFVMAVVVAFNFVLCNEIEYIDMTSYCL